MSVVEKFRVRGGTPLHGTVSVSGSKNAAVAIIPAALLSDDICTIDNLPEVSDVDALVEMLRFLGAKADMHGDTLTVDPRTLNSVKPPFDLASRLRASYYLLTALLGRCGEAEVPMPGGCDIGARPIDQTIKGIQMLGADYTNRSGVMVARAEKLVGAEVYLDIPSVGATVNTMLAAVKAEGMTFIYNAAKEPHVVDLANFLNSMGAHIKGAGTDIIRIRGVQHLHGTSYTIIPDQIETGTLMIAAAATHGDVVITGVIPTHMESLTAKLLETGVRIHDDDDIIHVMSSDNRFRGINFKTQYYPGFPTDLQQPMSALLTIANGTSIVTETVYEDRFKHFNEMLRLGASVNTSGRIAIIDGVEKLYGCPIHATDLRAGAALVVAALMAEGVSEISGVKYIDRGYESLESKLRLLGADIARIRCEE